MNIFQEFSGYLTDLDAANYINPNIARIRHKLPNIDKSLEEYIQTVRGEGLQVDLFHQGKDNKIE